VHIDLWELSPVVSAGGVYYFMLIIDSMSLFQFVEFLREKNIEVTLNMLKKFIMKAE